jgi:ribonuclease HI
LPEPPLCRWVPYADEAEIGVNRMRQHIHIVTDGSAIGNLDPGGWLAVLSCGRNKWRISGAVESATANEMELTAAIEALKSIEFGSRVTLCSDSEYLIRGMRHLADRWLRQGWRNTRGRPLRDQALWQTLMKLRADNVIEWLIVRATIVIRSRQKPTRSPTRRPVADGLRRE